MKNPFFDLLTELERQLIEINHANASQIEKCSNKITLCQQLCKELRELYFEEQIDTTEQQIHFFREVKPKFYS